MTATRNSFQKSERLKTLRELHSVLRKGCGLQEDGIALYYLGGRFRRQSRLGIIVSRRVFRNAWERNQAKRLVREFFRLRKNGFRESYDMVVKFIGSCNSLKKHNLGQVLTRLFERAGVFGAGA